MLISVTQEDIDKGERDCGKCPIALAASRAIGIPVDVGNREAWINGSPRVMPSIARQFILRFDAQLAVKPFSFELNYQPTPANTERET